MKAGATPKQMKSDSEFELGAELAGALQDPGDPPVEAVENAGDENCQNRELPRRREERSAGRSARRRAPAGSGRWG